MNILLITSEQQHHRTPGRTPALDRLAAGGLAFDRAYCTSPTCEPSRATMLTGWYPAWHRTEDPPTISALLSQLGYATSVIGRAHIAPAGQPSDKALLDLDFWRRWTGPYRGFDHAELSWNHAGEAPAGQHYALWLQERDTAELSAESRHGAWVAERTVAAIDAAVLSDRPFFCWASFDHGLITALDQHVGRILSRLDALEVAGETLVVFTSDHGSATAIPGEDRLRVPLVVRWPGRVPAGTRTSALHAHVDLAPTLVHALEITEPGRMQGESQLPVWLGQRDRVRDHLIVEHRDPEVQLRSYVEERHKLTVYRGTDRGDLFDLADDPDEHHNLFAHPAHADLKTALLHRFLDAELRREPH
jgi:uncharacterized sulfatase